MVKRSKREFEFDVCLSFAGEDRVYVSKVADYLRKSGVRVFYDRYEQTNLWGKDLYSHLDNIYSNSARYCVMFISKNYAKRLWTNHERVSAQARAFQEHKEYLLPVRFDQTRIDGIRDTIGYLDAKNMAPEKLGESIVVKTKVIRTGPYFPPVPDRLFRSMGVRKSSDKSVVGSRADSFFRTLTRMIPNEVKAVLFTFYFGCPAELPENIHINMDLLRRVTGIPIKELATLFKKISSLGYEVKIRKAKKKARKDSEGDVFVLVWNDMSVDDDIAGNATYEANEVVACIQEERCEDCSIKQLLSLDFSSLSQATFKGEKELHRKDTK